jgi:hypothetical protein
LTDTYFHVIGQEEKQNIQAGKIPSTRAQKDGEVVGNKGENNQGSDPVESSGPWFGFRISF